MFQVLFVSLPTLLIWVQKYLDVDEVSFWLINCMIHFCCLILIHVCKSRSNVDIMVCKCLVSVVFICKSDISMDGQSRSWYPNFVDTFPHDGVHVVILCIPILIEILCFIQVPSISTNHSIPQIPKFHWLVLSTPLKNMSSSDGDDEIPYFYGSKPPNSLRSVHVSSISTPVVPHEPTNGDRAFAQPPRRPRSAWPSQAQHHRTSVV